ncbi:MAG: hypothetical protein IJZ32_01595 [Clostridia bacterium]|nr:hypothetical protein [Clostridia bacterium]
MKKKLKNKIIVFLLALMSLFILGGCSLGASLNDVKKDYNLTAQVTYYANGGVFNNSKTQKDMYYTAGSKALNIGVVNPTSGSVSISNSQGEFDGWYFIELDGEGNPVFEDEEKGLYKLTDNKVDFTVALADGDHWIVGAKWKSLTNLKVQIVVDTGLTVPFNSEKINSSMKLPEGVSEKTGVVNGDIIGEFEYNRNDRVFKKTEPFTVADKSFTFVEYYLDEACTQLAFPSAASYYEKQGENDTIYAKYIAGEWTIVKDGVTASTMFSAMASGRYWLIADIDMSEYPLEKIVLATGCEIQGNGKTLSNLKVKREQGIGAGDNNVYSLLGTVQASAKIENLTIENVTMTYKTVGECEIYFVCNEIEAGATITNVSISGSLTVKNLSGGSVTNLENGLDHCLYGGFASDADYTEENGFKVEYDYITVE